MTSTLRPRNIQGDRISIQEVETETLIYDERTHKAWCLNRSSACIWRLCNGEHTVSEIAANASAELSSPVSEDLVLFTLDELGQKELLRGPVHVLPKELSRREIMAKAGLTAAALLPVIAALTAPPASAQTASAGTGDTERSNIKPDY
jgi:hypothetical protein